MVASRHEGGSWPARVAALTVVCGFVASTLAAGWKTITLPFGWPVAAWAGGLVLGVVATPRVLHIVYETTVVRTWRNYGPLGNAADNRRWWLRRYTATMTRPYGVLAAAAVVAFRLAAGGRAPIDWVWCLVVIVAITSAVLVAGGGIPRDPEMPALKEFRIRLWPALLAIGLFTGAHFLHVAWVFAVLFLGVLFMVTAWTAFAVIGAAKLFLRVDHGHSESYPMD